MHDRRKLGFWETICKYGHDYFSGTGIVVSVVSLQGVIDPKKFVDILHSLYLRHPLLRATIQEVSYKFFFELNAKFSEIPIEFSQVLSKDLLSLNVEEEMNKPFPITKYLWRAKVVCDSSQTLFNIIFSFHHAIADGLSTANLAKELLHLYAQNIDLDKFEQARLPMLPHVEALLTSPNSWQDFLFNKTNLTLPEILPWEFQNFVPLKQRRTRNIVVPFSEHKLRQLHHRCREEKTTINSALNATMLLSAYLLQETTLNVTLHTPVNLRSYCQPKLTLEHLGCYISMVKTNHIAIDNRFSFWSLARAYHHELVTNIPKIGFCPNDFYVGDFDVQTIMDLFDMPGSTKRKYFNGGFGVSNLGYIDFPQTFAGLNFDSFYFCTNRNMGDYIIFLNIVSQPQKMLFCFCYSEPLINEIWARRFVDKFMEILSKNDL